MCYMEKAYTVMAFNFVMTIRGQKLPEVQLLTGKIQYA